MEKRGIILILVLTIFLSFSVLAISIDNEIQKITHYAEEYETENIDYVRLLLYTSAVREALNEELGAIGMNEGGFLKQEQIEKVLGEPTEETRWVWAEGEQQDIKLDKAVPVWQKIVFDGKKIQMRLGAWPTIFTKKRFDDKPEIKDCISNCKKECGYDDEDEDCRSECITDCKEKFDYFDYEKKKKLFEELEGKIIYRLHFEIEFKKPEKQLDIKGKINEIQAFAEAFNSNPSRENAETLAKESVNAEMIFERYFKQNQGKCEDIMIAVFGAENQRETQQILLQEITFYEGDNFEAIMKLEMCDECEWNWIDMNMWLEGRGPGFKFPKDVKDMDERDSMERFKGMDSKGFMSETIELLEEIKRFLEEGDFGPAVAYSQRLSMLTQAWNEKSNNVWEEVEKNKEDTSKEEVIEFKEAQTKPEQRDPYYWVKEEQERRQKERELRKRNYEERKQFYLGLFSSYDFKEYYFKQQEWMKRLVEEFREFGEEICDNNKDDNDNGEVDCEESQCGGKFCGQETTIVEKGNSSEEEIIDLYCIAQECKAKKEINKTVGPICGNDICEEGEEVCSSSSVVCDENNSECFATADCGPIYCPEDCILCPEHLPINCSEEGKVIFKGKDENGCPLEPVCIEPEPCEVDEDCKFLCGEGKCMGGVCELEELVRCKEPECTDGDKKIEECLSGEEIVSAICVEGMWTYPDIFCPGKEEVCCQTPGPADEPTYKWKSKQECQSPEGAEWPDVIVDENYCEETCVEAGGDTGVHGSKCCENLKMVSDCLPNQQCPISLRYCVDCGNNVCEGHENWYNCPKDCEEEEEEKTCGEYCRSVEEVAYFECPGHMEVSGVYPGCNCDWVCEEKKDECTYCSDCGSGCDDYDCSNGECKKHPKKIPVEKEEEPEEPEEPGIELPKEPEEPKEEELLPEPEPEPTLEPSLEPTPEPEPESQEEPETTGAVIFAFFRALISKINPPQITGQTITGFDVEGGDGNTEPEPPEEPGLEIPDEPGPPDGPNEPGPGPEPDNDCADKWKECGGPCPPCDYDKGPDDDWKDEGGGEDNWKEDGDRKEKDREERGMNERERKENCKRNCNMPCVNKCIREACGEKFDCDVDETSKKCEKECEPEEKCIEKCIEGEEDWWKEFEDKEENKEEKGVFEAGGTCRKQQGRTGGFIWLNGWGDPFDKIQPIKHKYYSGGHADWCKQDLDNFIKQRKEFEKGFNQKFITWFFEKYLANSAENWEQSVSGIFELYWNNVDTMMQLSQRMQCLEINDINEIMNYNLISINYKTEYGRLEYWEEVKKVKMPEIEKEVTIISPYMKIWIFPSKSFMIYEMQQSMKNHEFPGPPEEKIERKNEEGLTAEDKERIRQDKRTMQKIEEIIQKYNGNLDAVMQFKDLETGEVVFNLYAQVNEQDLIKMEPMLPAEVPAEDARVEIDFEKIYDLIYSMEKDMQGEMIESPPWDRRPRPIQRVKEITNGVKMWFKMRAIKNSAKVFPKEAEKDMEFLFEFFFSAMGGGPKEGPGGFKEGPEGMNEKEKIEEIEGEIWDSKEKITGEVVG